MVGMLGCGCCATGCCPEGNTWTYGYYPFTPNWPLDWSGYDPKYADFTPNGLEIKSHAPFTRGPNFGSSTTVSLQSRRDNYYGDPPIKHGFGTSDTRNLKHGIFLPTPSEFEAWDPFVDASFYPNYGPVPMEMIIELGIAIRPANNLFNGWSVGFSVTWTKRKGFINGGMLYQWQTKIDGWKGNQDFSGRIIQSSRVYGFVDTSTNTCPTGIFFFNGSNFPNVMDVKSELGSLTGIYDCSAARIKSGTRLPDGTSQPPWISLSEQLVDLDASLIYGEFFCFPYYLIRVTFKSQFPDRTSFANTKVVLNPTQWQFGNVLP